MVREQWVLCNRLLAKNPSLRQGLPGVKVSKIVRLQPQKILDAFDIYKSLGLVCMVMRVAVTAPVKDATTLFVSGASSVNFPEK